MSCHTGIIKKKVIKRAKLIKTWLGGVCWVPIAWRMKPKITMMRTKEVTMISIEGAKARTVKMNMTLMTVAILSGSSDSPILIETVGIGTMFPSPWARAKGASKIRSTAKIPKSAKRARRIFGLSFPLISKVPFSGTSLSFYTLLAKALFKAKSKKELTIKKAFFGSCQKGNLKRFYFLYYL
jgi:hypothetical protein